MTSDTKEGILFILLLIVPISLLGLGAYSLVLEDKRLLASKLACIAKTNNVKECMNTPATIEECTDLLRINQ